MNYIVPKYFLSNFSLAENNKIFKIKYIIDSIYPITLFGIIVQLDVTKIVKTFGEYYIYITNVDELKKYDTYLSDNIKDYKSFIRNKKNEYYVVLSTRELIEKNDRPMYLNIRYVKKTGFLNIPIISIHNG